MKRLILVGLILFIARPSWAQDTPKAEIFGGYSYHRDESFTFSFFGPPAPRNKNFHGWNASIAGNVNRWFGVVADFSGHYGDRRPGQGARVHTFTFGPQFSYRGNEKITPFARILVGVVNSRTNFPVLGSNSNTALAGHLGVGLDWNASERISVRLIQADALLSFPGAGTRLSFGIVFKLGKK